MDLKNLQQGITFFTTIIGIITLIASIIYDYFFFSCLGLGFNQIPLSFSDITQTFLSWLPYALMNAAIIILLIWIYFPGGRPSISPSQHKQLTAVYVTVWILMAVNLAIYILLGDVAKQMCIQGLLLFLLLFTLWVSNKITGFLIRYESIKKFERYKVYLTVYYAIGFFLIIGYDGYCDGLKLRDIAPTSTVVSTSSRQIIKTNILRALDKGIIIGSKEESPVFMPWTAISDIRSTMGHEEFKGVLCKWFKKRCQPYQGANI